MTRRGAGSSRSRLGSCWESPQQSSPCWDSRHFLAGERRHQRGKCQGGGHTSRSLARSVFCLLLGCGLELPPCPVSRGALPVEKGCTGGCVQPGSSQREAWRGGGGGGRGQCLSPKPSSCKYPPTAMLWPRDHSPAPPLRLGPAPSPPTAALGW